MILWKNGSGNRRNGGIKINPLEIKNSGYNKSEDSGMRGNHLYCNKNKAGIKRDSFYLKIYNLDG